MVLELQQRATQHGHWRHYTRYETANGSLNSTAGPHKHGGLPIDLNYLVAF